MKELLIFIFIVVCCHPMLVTCQNKEQRQNEKIDTAMDNTLKYHNRSKTLVEGLRKKGIVDERILDAILEIPRHEFVTSNLADLAYEDKPLPIDKDQTISQPYTVAFQTQLLEVKVRDKVLEIGTGSGYQAAVLCEIGAQVYSIERHQQLHIKAKHLLNKLGYHPILVYGDGYEGLPEYAPFDKILITAAIDEIPEKLLKQLKIGGLIVAPVGNREGQVMTVVRRTDVDKYKKTEHGLFIFVPMLEGVEE